MTPNTPTKISTQINVISVCRSNICWATEEFGACRFIFQSALAINGNIAAPRADARVADAHLLDAWARQFCLPVSTESIPFRTTTPQYHGQLLVQLRVP